MKRQFVKDLKAGVLVNDIFLCSRRDVKERRDGVPFVTFEFRDKTGSVNGIMWDKVEDALNFITPGTFCRVQGRVGDYQGKLQLTVSIIVPANDSEVSRGDFIAVSRYSCEDMTAELRGYIEGVTAPHLRSLLNSFFGDKQFMQEFQNAPAAQQVHHACIGGLLEHTVLMCRIARVIPQVYPEVNHDLLLTGIILHDVGKTREYVYEKAIDHSLDGRLIGHIVTGYQMVQDKIAAIPDFPAEPARMLLHIILSHHGQMEFGSPKTPKFAEALIVHFLDNLDARVAMFRDAVEKNPNVKWTDFHQYLETNIYIPDKPA
jgi:3'-5' exoribonuclease